MGFWLRLTMTTSNGVRDPTRGQHHDEVSVSQADALARGEGESACASAEDVAQSSRSRNKEGPNLIIKLM